MTKTEILLALKTVAEWAGGLVPGFIGALVATLMEKTASVSQRVVQFAVGIIVSYFAGNIGVELFHPGPFVAQGISFTAGMVAYKAVPKFIESFAKTAEDVPTDLWGFIKKKLGIGS